MPAGRRLLSRRTTLALGVAGLVVVAGCDDGGDGSGDRPANAPTPAQDPDGDLVDSVLTALTDTLEIVGHVGDRFPGLAAPMAPLRALHTAHIEALDGTPPTTFAGSGVIANPEAALTLVRRREKRLRSDLVESAVVAESGTLARVLASMSAAVAQHLVTLPGEVVMTTIEALQTTLAAEHAAVYVYAALGGRTSRSGDTRPLRRRLVRLRRAPSAPRPAERRPRGRGRDPVAAEAAYDLPTPLLTPDQVSRAALDVERSCATTYAYLVANTAADQRRWAIEALNEAAVRELAFRGTPETFPGAGEYADR